MKKDLLNRSTSIDKLYCDPSFVLPEEAYDGDYNIATYFYKSVTETDVYEKAKAFAIGQTIGTWVSVPGITTQMTRKYGGKVVAIYSVPPAELTPDSIDINSHIIQIAFPDNNFIPQLPILLTTLIGNDASTSAQVKLIDLKFSKNFLSAFKGPRFGIEGIYNFFGISRRPIVLNMIKPCLGYTAAEGAEIFRKIALGGIDIIKDDELFADTKYSSIYDRVKAYTKVAKEVQEETGHLTSYCVNITDRTDKCLEHARRAVDAGAGMLMINFIATGISTLQAISENKEINIPILAHYAGSGSMTESPYTGISSTVLLGKLSRLAGADMCMLPSPYSTYPFLKIRYKQIADIQRSKFGDLHETMPTIGGGVHPNSAEKIVDDLGIEIVLAAGGAVLGHPLGPTEGARSMMQAAEALGKNIKLREVAGNKGFESLKISLEKWQ